jgi:ligand-binding SRPBCC domain-containing protein
MPTFVRSILIRAPVETVFRFHQRDDALRLLSPAFPPLRVIEKTGGIERGARVVLGIGPIRWVALHTAFEKNRFFVDRQISGPFAEWIHRHEFETVGDATRLTDRVNYRLPGGPWTNRLLGWAVRAGLERMFRLRQQTTKHYCETEALL